MRFRSAYQRHDTPPRQIEIHRIRNRHFCERAARVLRRQRKLHTPNAQSCSFHFEIDELNFNSRFVPSFKAPLDSRQGLKLRSTFNIWWIIVVMYVRDPFLAICVGSSIVSSGMLTASRFADRALLSPAMTCPRASSRSIGWITHRPLPGQRVYELSALHF